MSKPSYKLSYLDNKTNDVSYNISIPVLLWIFYELCNLAMRPWVGITLKFKSVSNSWKSNMWPDFFGNYVPLHGQYLVHWNLQSICVVSRSFLRKHRTNRRNKKSTPSPKTQTGLTIKYLSYGQIFKLRTKNSHQEFIKIVDRKADISYCRVIMI